MKVHLIKKKTIYEFIKHNNQSQSSFENWLNILKYADWSKPSDIVSTFSTADILGNSSQRVIFNIGGNNYRMIAKYYFGKQSVHLFILWIGTHGEYDKICKEGTQYSINKY